MDSIMAITEKKATASAKET
jgi:hypothetical protein